MACKNPISNDGNGAFEPSLLSHLKEEMDSQKRFASLRLCVSFLLRDHANLLCIFKRLFDAQSEDWADDE
jgi:hypothetical protein